MRVFGWIVRAGVRRLYFLGADLRRGKRETTDLALVQIVGTPFADSCRIPRLEVLAVLADVAHPLVMGGILASIADHFLLS